MKKIIFAALCLLAAASISAQTQNYWKPFSSKSLPDGGPISGSINGITIDSANHIYVETGGDGVLQSTDGGDTWHGFNEGLRVLPFQKMASSTFEYDSINHIPIAYVYGVSQRNELMRRLFNTKSGDSRWEYLMNIINQDGVRAKTIQVTTSGDLLTNRKGYLYLPTPNFGVLRSRTRGESFDTLQNLSAPLPDSFIVCMAIHRPTQDLYVISQSNVHLNSTPGNWITHLSRSTDAGTTWERLPSTMPFPLLINKILIADDGSIILGYHHNTIDTASLARVFRSTDMGQTWDSAIELPHLKESDVDAMVIAPRGHDIYINVHGPTFRSTDNGATWTNGNQNKMGEETFHVAMDTNNAVYQVAIPDGCFKSTDNGLTFVDKDTDLAVQHMDGGIAVNSKGTIFACSQFNMYRFPNAAGGWDNLTNELDEATNPYFTIDQEDRVFYGSYWGLFRSMDNGDTFDTVVRSNPNAEFAFQKENQVFYHGVNAKDWIFVSCAQDTNGLNPKSEFFFLRSKQHGDHLSWERINNGTNTGQFQPLVTEQIGCFDFSPATGDTCFAAEVMAGKTYRSTNGGTNWEVVNTPAAVGVVQFVCHPDGSVFRVQSGGLGSGSDGVYRSVDNGVTWTKVFPPDSTLIIPSYSAVKPLFLDRSGRILINAYQYSPGDNVPIDTTIGVTDSLIKSGFYLSDTTDHTFKTWRFVSSGFDADSWFTDSTHHLNCSMVAQDKKTGFYYGNSRGRSVFVSTWPDFDPNEKGVPITHLPSSITEPVNYPNPFMKTTEINFDVPHSGMVKISLFDVMGRLVQVIANGNMTAGAHTMPFDANANITSGQYMLLLESGSDRISHWMTITK